MTRRQDIIKLLEQGPVSANSIANKFGTNLKEIFEDLEHIKKSIKPRQLKITPAHCRKCSYVFRERKRLSTPSKCPQCRGEWIEREKFSVG